MSLERMRTLYRCSLLLPVVVIGFLLFSTAAQAGSFITNIHVKTTGQSTVMRALDSVFAKYDLVRVGEPVPAANADLAKYLVGLDSIGAGLKVKGTLVSPSINGWVSIYDSYGDWQVPEVGDWAEQLSREMKTAALLFIVHDSDILLYQAYDSGVLLDEYQSIPDYWGDVTEEEKMRLAGKPDVLAGLAGKPDKKDVIASLLKADNFTFADDQLEALSRELGISNTSFSYAYIADLIGTKPLSIAGLDGFKLLVYEAKK